MADLAAGAGVGHLVFSSVCSADKNTGIPHFDSKYQVERYLAAGSVPFTVVRPVFLMENWELYREATQGADGELGEDLAKVVFGGAWADEQPGGDLGVGQAFGGQPCDLGFLGGEPGGGPGASPGVPAPRSREAPARPGRRTRPPRWRRASRGRHAAGRGRRCAACGDVAIRRRAGGRGPGPLEGGCRRDG